jgi:hypothetical protein
MNGIQKTPPTPLRECQLFFNFGPEGLKAGWLPFRTWEDLHHEDIQVSGIIDLVGGHMPFRCLRKDAWNGCTRLEVRKECRYTDGHEDQVLLRPRPVKGIVCLIGRLGNEDSVSVSGELQTTSSPMLNALRTDIEENSTVA